MWVPVLALPKFKGLVLPARGALFLRYVHFMWQMWHFQDILRSKTSLCLTGGRISDAFSSAWQGWHFLRVLQRWQALVKMTGGFGGLFVWQAQYLVNFDDALKRLKVSFCGRRSAL